MLSMTLTCVNFKYFTMGCLAFLCGPLCDEVFCSGGQGHNINSGNILWLGCSVTPDIPMQVKQPGGMAGIRPHFSTPSISFSASVTWCTTKGLWAPDCLWSLNRSMFAGLASCLQVLQHLQVLHHACRFCSIFAGFATCLQILQHVCRITSW